MPRRRVDEPKLDRVQIVTTAAELVNEGGPGALSMNALARRLHVQPPSLYNHVGGLPEIRLAMSRMNARRLAEVFAEAAIGRSGSAAVRSIAEAYRRYILENAGLYMATLRASGTEDHPDEELARLEERVVAICLTILEPFHLATEDALHAVRGLRSLVHGFAGLEAAGGFGMSMDSSESFRRLVEAFVGALERGGFGDRKPA